MTAIDQPATVLDAATRQAREVRDLYEILEKRINGRVWSLHELMLGFTNDVGTVGRLILAQDGTWDIDGDVNTQLQRKLAENLWWVIVIADRMGIDIGSAYETTMRDIRAGLAAAVTLK